MKKKKQHNKSKDYEEKYKAVAAALSFMGSIRQEERRKEQAKKKAQHVLSIMSFVGSCAVATLLFVTNFRFDFSWMTSFGEWYSELFISLAIYTILTGLVLMLERRFKLDQSAAFGYIWPFVGFMVSMLLTKSMTAYIMNGEFNLIAGLIMLGGLLTYFLMSNAVKMGKLKAQEEISMVEKAMSILEDNPEIVDDVLTDFEKSQASRKEGEGSSKQENNEEQG